MDSLDADARISCSKCKYVSQRYSSVYICNINRPYDHIKGEFLKSDVRCERKNDKGQCEDFALYITLTRWQRIKRVFNMLYE